MPTRIIQEGSEDMSNQVARSSYDLGIRALYPKDDTPFQFCGKALHEGRIYNWLANVTRSNTQFICPTVRIARLSACRRNICASAS
eukprot:5246157-Amphidinium_carterae.1